MMFRSALAVATLVSVAHAQTIYEIEPDTVDELIRENWCMNSMSSCPLICNQYEPPETLINTCDPETLTYGCLCGEGQGIKPNMSEYSLTIPYFVCMEWGNQCVTGCNGNTACATSCREDNPCGAQDPTRLNETESSTTTTGPPSSRTSDATSTTDDGTTIFTGTPGSEDEDDSSSDDDSSSSSSSTNDDDDSGSGAVSLLAMGSNFGLTVVMGAMFLGFALF